MMNTKLAALLTAAATTALLSAGCAAPRLPPNAQNVSFPQREASYRSEGIVASPEMLQLIRAGLSKDQVRQLLGNPHFTEGLFFVKDWNYLIDIAQPEGEKLNCQLQLQFEDSVLTARHWQTEACAAAAQPALMPSASAEAAPATAAAPTPAPAAAAAALPPVEARGESLSLHGLLFPFARSQLADLPAEALARLESFAASVGLRAAEVQEVVIYGHADRIGPLERREQRSLSRARAVAEVFIRKGIDTQRITIVAKGSEEPLTDCSARLPHTQLLGCLAPDRRVTIAVRLVGG